MVASIKDHRTILGSPTPTVIHRSIGLGVSGMQSLNGLGANYFLLSCRYELLPTGRSFWCLYQQIGRRSDSAINQDWTFRIPTVQPGRKGRDHTIERVSAKGHQQCKWRSCRLASWSYGTEEFIYGTGGRGEEGLWDRFFCHHFVYHSSRPQSLFHDSIYCLLKNKLWLHLISCSMSFLSRQTHPQNYQKDLNRRQHH